MTGQSGPRIVPNTARRQMSQMPFVDGASESQTPPMFALVPFAEPLASGQEGRAPGTGRDEVARQYVRAMARYEYG